MLLHHGEILEKVIRRTGPSLTDLAKLMNVNRRSVYNWFLQPKLKPEIIVRIGRTIGHDFSVEFPNLFVSSDFEGASIEAESQQAIDVWKEKYNDLLERYNFVLKLQEKRSASSVAPVYNVLFVNENSNEFVLDLNNAPSEIFIEKCRRAGYKIKCINRAELPRDRTPSKGDNVLKIN
jgi:plasmid maintenance system antidote protein VapI